MENVSIGDIESLIKEEAQAVAEENSINEIITGGFLLSTYRWLAPLGNIINNIDISGGSELPPSLKNIISWTRKSKWLQTMFKLAKELKDVAEHMKENHPVSYKTTILPLLALDPFASMANITAEQAFDFWWGRMKKNIDAEGKSQKEIQAALVNSLESEREDLRKALEAANKALQAAQNDEKEVSSNKIPAKGQEGNEKMFINEEKLKNIILESIIEVITENVVAEGSPSLEVGDDDDDNSSNDDEVENLPGSTYDNTHGSKGDNMSTIAEDDGANNDWQLITSTRGPWVIEKTGASGNERYWIRNVRDENNQVVPMWGSLEDANVIDDALRAYRISSNYDMASLRLASDLD